MQRRLDFPLSTLCNNNQPNCITISPNQNEFLQIELKNLTTACLKNRTAVRIVFSYYLGVSDRHLLGIFHCLNTHNRIIF